MGKRVVFLTGEQIGANSAESLHLYKRIVSFKKSGDVTVITQSSDTYAERAGCNKVVHLTAQSENLQDAEEIVNQADMFVVVGTAPNATPSSELLRATKSGCCIAIINKGCLELPKGLHRDHVVRMRDMSVGTGLMFLSMYRWLADLVEE